MPGIVLHVCGAIAASMLVFVIFFIMDFYVIEFSDEEFGNYTTLAATFTSAICLILITKRYPFVNYPQKTKNEPEIPPAAF